MESVTEKGEREKFLQAFYESITIVDDGGAPIQFDVLEKDTSEDPENDRAEGE